MWRMYIVYGKRFRVIIPAIILMIAYTGMSAIVRADPPLTRFYSSDWYLHTRHHQKGSPRYWHFPRVDRFDHGVFLPDDDCQCPPHGQVFSCARVLIGIFQHSHTIRCDHIADSYCWKPSASFEAALAYHIYTRGELRSVYCQYHRSTRDHLERFLWAIGGSGCDCPSGCKRPVYLGSAIRLPLIHTFALGHFFLSHRASDSVPCQCRAWPSKSFLGPARPSYSVAQSRQSPRWRGRSQLYSNDSPRIRTGRPTARGG